MCYRLPLNPQNLYQIYPKSHQHRDDSLTPNKSRSINPRVSAKTLAGTLWYTGRIEGGSFLPSNRESRLVGTRHWAQIWRGAGPLWCLPVLSPGKLNWMVVLTMWLVAGYCFFHLERAKQGSYCMELKSKSGLRGSLSLTENASNHKLYLLLEEPKFFNIFSLNFGSSFCFVCRRQLSKTTNPKNCWN